MNNHILHVGLQISAKDLRDFYMLVLKFEETHSFELNAENSETIFQIANPVTVHVGFCPEINFELFVAQPAATISYNHICFESNRISDIENKAKKYDYRNVYFEHSGTLFLADSSNNIFEIKPLN